MGKERRLRRIAQRDTAITVDELKTLSMEYLVALQMPKVQKDKSHRKVFLMANERWKRLVPGINKRTKINEATDASFEIWLWKLMQQCHKEKMTGDNKRLLRLVKKSVGMKWRIKMWLHDFKNNN